MSSFFEAVGDVAEGVGDIAEGVVEGVGDVAEGVADFVGDTVETVGDVVTGIIEDPKKLAAVAIAVAFPGAGTAVGQSLLGPTLAASLGSVATQVIGQTIINTAINGGDLENGLMTAGLSVMTPALAKEISSEAVANGVDKTIADAGAKVAAGTIKAAALGRDPVTAFTFGAIDQATDVILDKALTESGTRDQFNALPDSAKIAVAASITSSLTGADASALAADMIVDRAIATAAKEVKQQDAKEFARKQFADIGYDMTDDELNQVFQNIDNRDDAKKIVQGFQDRKTTENQIEDFLEENGVTPTPELVASFAKEWNMDLAAPTFSATSTKDLRDALANADLTDDEREAVRGAMQDVFSMASTAQALPAFTTDTTQPIGRLGSPFASNDPRFYSAMVKNPELYRKFSEYSNTYGFNTSNMNQVYSWMLGQELQKTPNDKNLLEEYKRITGTDYNKLPDTGAGAGRGSVNPDLVSPGATPKTPVTPSTPEYQVKPGDYSDTTEEIQPWQNIINDVDKGYITLDEALNLLGQFDYEATPEEAVQFTGVMPEDIAKEKIGEYTQANTVTRDEARQALIDAGIPNPTDYDVNILVGKYAQTELPSRATEAKPAAEVRSSIRDVFGDVYEQQFNKLQNAIKTDYDLLTNAQKAEVASRVKMGEDLGKAIGDVAGQISGLSNQYTSLGSQVTGLQDQLAAEKAANEAYKKEQEAKAAKAAQTARNTAWGSGLAGLSGLLASGAPVVDESAPQAKAEFLTSKAIDTEFESPLAQFQQKVEGMPELPDNPLIDQGNKDMASFYSYGNETPVDAILGLGGDQQVNPAEDKPYFMAQGGMATPLMAAQGGFTGTRHGRYARGGAPSPLVAAGGKMRVDFRHGDAVSGAGDGQSDDIPAMLADGEFVFPADVVAAIGNGSTKAGSDKLYDMMHSIRAHVRSAKPKELPPEIKSPLDFLKTSKKRSA